MPRSKGKIEVIMRIRETARLCTYLKEDAKSHGLDPEEDTLGDLAMFRLAQLYEAIQQGRLLPEGWSWDLRTGAILAPGNEGVTARGVFSEKSGGTTKLADPPAAVQKTPSDPSSHFADLDMTATSQDGEGENFFEEDL